jgi:hypothetical protein
MIGKSYKLDNTLGVIFATKAQIVKCIFLSIGYYLIFYALLKKISSIKIEFKTKKKTKLLEEIINVIDKYQIIIGIIIILLAYLPYIIYYFPGASTGDTFDSLAQFFHQKNSWSINTINLINDNVYINKHHPPLFTVVIGLIFKLGKYINSYTTGAFIYTILQIILSYEKTKNTPLDKKLYYTILCIYPINSVICIISNKRYTKFNIYYIIRNISITNSKKL